MHAELTPLVLRIAVEALRAKRQSDVNHSMADDWTSSDASTDAEMATWLTALGMVLQDMRGADGGTKDDARKAGGQFLEEHAYAIGQAQIRM